MKFFGLKLRKKHLQVYPPLKRFTQNVKNEKISITFVANQNFSTLCGGHIGKNVSNMRARVYGHDVFNYALINLFSSIQLYD